MTEFSENDRRQAALDRAYDEQVAKGNLTQEEADDLKAADRALRYRELNAGQVERAGLSLTMRPKNRMRFKPQRLHAIARYMAPGQLWLVTANTGIGKTTFLLSTIDDLVQQGYKVAVLGLEEQDHDLRAAFACLRAEVPRYIATENSWAEHPDGAEMLARVRRQLELQTHDPLAEQLLFLPQRHINSRTLVDAAEEAADFGAQVFVVDHLHHMEGGFEYRAFSANVLQSKFVAEQFDMVNISAAQIGRAAMQGGHRLSRYMPAQLHQIQGGGVIEQNASVVLNLYRPVFKPQTKADKDLITRAMKGDVEPIDVLLPNRMGVAVLKHRPVGALEGKRCVLALDNGKLIDPPEDELQ